VAAAGSAGLTAEPAWSDMAGWLAGGNEATDITRRLSDWLLQRPELIAQGTPMDSAAVGAPVPRPPATYCVAGNYARHIAEGSSGQKPPAKSETIPYFFSKPLTAVSGPYARVTPSALARRLDHEVELGVVIGRRCQAVEAEQALQYVAGYLVFDDLSARSIASPPGRRPRPDDEFFDFLLGKWGDGCAPMGPYLVTPDEIPDPQRLTMELRVNGELRQAGSTAEMIFSIAELIAWLSSAVTLETGAVIATGTTSGVAYATGRWLHGGDTVEATIDGLGCQRTTIGHWKGDAPE